MAEPMDAPAGNPRFAALQQARTSHRRPQYDSWRSETFRVGAQLVPIAPPAGAARPVATLAAWLDVSSFPLFASSGNIFASTAVPAEYQALVDESGVPWVWHPRTKVLVWPVRIDLGAVADAQDAATVYHYCGAQAMDGISNLLCRGASASVILDYLENDSLTARECFGEVDPRDLEGGGFATTVLEPAQFATRNDLVFDRLGMENWPPAPELLEVTSRCLPLRVPVHVLDWEDVDVRKDRVLVLGDRLKPYLQAFEKEHSVLAPIGNRSLFGEGAGVPERPPQEVHKSTRSSCCCRRRVSDAEPAFWRVDVAREDLLRTRELVAEAASRPISSLRIAPQIPKARKAPKAQAKVLPRKSSDEWSSSSSSGSFDAEQAPDNDFDFKSGRKGRASVTFGAEAKGKRRSAGSVTFKSEATHVCVDDAFNEGSSRE